jgi:hypothetical protein
MRNAVCAALLLTSLAACTGVEPASTPKGDNEYMTGSNIPRRAPPSDVQVMSKEQAEEVMRTRAGPAMGRGM